MEVLASVVGSLIAEPCRALFTFLLDKLRNPLHFSSNLVALDQELEDLIERRDRLREHLAMSARAGLQTPSQVRDWLGQVSILENHVQSLKDDLVLRARNSACSVCLCCSNLSDQVARRLGEARKLSSAAGEFPQGEGGAAPDPSMVRTEYIPAPTIDDQPISSRNMAKVMDLLSRQDVKRIGIWGMGGVGKTTLVKNINNKLTKTSPKSPSFSIVIWITVSNKTQETELELKKVQKLIADRLRLTLTEESMETRASKLHARLMMMKTFLLILDDVWDLIDLDLVGIPSPELHKGGKIILTTRFSNICLQMTEVTLKIEALNEEEAWRLFCTSAGEVATLREVEPFARAITKECAGLPLAIVVVGASLRGMRMVELWKDALNTLCRSEPLIRGRIEDKVYNPIKWSYDVLPNECIKSCFLFCCLFPEDFEINVKELVRYWLAEGLLEGHHDIEEVMDRGMTIIEILKDGSLLEQVYPSTVKLHDVIRDVSVWISSSVQKECKSLVRSGIGLHRIREGELLGKSYKRVSFMNNQINELPNMVKECPTVSTLLLQQNKALEGVQDQFLAAFMSLKILDLSYCNLIKSLPPCLDQLGELRALVLDSCTHLETLPPLGGLAKLQVLVCSGTDIAALPQGTEKLTSLRLLDLSYNSRLAVIHCGVMSGLCNLEYLDMRGNKRLKFIGERGEISNLFEEISHLDRLIVLLVGLDSSACTIETTNTLVNRMMKFKKFELSIGSSSKVTTVDLERTKVVSLLNIHVWGERMEWLFVNSTSVYFQCCESLDVAFEKLAANSDEVGSFDTVKFLFISDSTGWFGVGSHAKFDMLPNLENIFFEDLTHVSGISDLVPPLGLKFSKLRYIKVAGCPELKYLITTRVPLTLEMLEEISVHRCKKVEQLFKFDHQNSVLFPNLEKINLSSCPKLKYLISLGTTMPLALEMLKEVSVHHCEQLEQLFKFDDHHQNSVLFPKLKKINLFECPKLKYLISLGTIMPLALEMLERVVVHRCEQVEQLFKFDHHHHHHHNSVLFPNLKKIDLSDCPKLRLLIEEKNNVGCPRLEEVSVWRCPLLKKLPISPQNVGTIKTIRGEQEWWDGLEWDNDHIKNNLQSYFKP